LFVASTLFSTSTSPAARAHSNWAVRLLTNPGDVPPQFLVLPQRIDRIQLFCQRSIGKKLMQSLMAGRA
jgi:hypothetical protein